LISRTNACDRHTCLRMTFVMPLDRGATRACSTPRAGWVDVEKAGDAPFHTSQVWAVESGYIATAVAQEGRCRDLSTAC
jgi:hypothetical protein